jgi:signal transduction histidine kinase
MTRLLDDLLLLARNGTGFQLPRAPARLDQITTSSLEQFGQLYPAEVVHAGPLASATVEGNEDALRRLVFILLDNVGQHARPGGQVWVRVVVESNHVCLVVADDGPGIPPADLERVFERFFQASPSRSQAGSGLGLAIARWIATDHGGTLTATNNDVGGATFTLVLPVESIAANVTATAATVAS